MRPQLTDCERSEAGRKLYGRIHCEEPRQRRGDEAISVEIASEPTVPRNLRDCFG